MHKDDRVLFQDLHLEWEFIRKRTMKKKIIRSVLLLILLWISLPQLSAAENASEKMVSPAQAFFEKLVGGKWVYQGKNASGIESKTEATFKQDPGKDSFYAKFVNYSAGSFKDALNSIIAFNPGKNAFVFNMVGYEHGYQEGEELESSKKHIVFIGKAYHYDGTKAGYFWGLELTNPDTFKYWITVFEHGAMTERRTIEFKRIRD